MRSLLQSYDVALFLWTTLWHCKWLKPPCKTCYCLSYRKHIFSTRVGTLPLSLTAFSHMSKGSKGSKANVEIERKFLVFSTAYREKHIKKHYIRQGYLFASKEKSIRVRLTEDAAYLTIKGETFGLRRKEFEYPIPPSDAEQLLDSLCNRPQIEKTRYIVEEKGFVWEVDEFHGENSGLVVAEVELEDESVKVELPDWVGREITQDTRFYNSTLSQSPFCDWPKEEREKIAVQL